MAKSTNASRLQGIPRDLGLDLTKGIDAFVELYDLLEEYGPAWYSETVHVRAQSGLGVLRELRASRKPVVTESRNQP
jgi:hypothetical protein